MAIKGEETFTCPFCGKEYSKQSWKRHQKTKTYRWHLQQRIQRRKAEFAARKTRAKERKLAEIEARHEWDRAIYQFLRSQGVTWDELAADEREWLRGMTPDEIREALAARGGH